MSRIAEDGGGSAERSASIDPAEIAELRQEIHSLRERLAAVEAQCVTESEAEDSSVTATDAARCEAGYAPEKCLSRKLSRLSRKSLSRSTRFMLWDTSTKHCLEESFWDATLFAGFDEVGGAASLMIFFGVTVSFFLQLIFCWVVQYSFLDTDFKYNVEYLREWRMLYGHSVHNYDEASGASLVSKVCKGRTFERHYWNNALLNEISAYLEPAFSSNFPSLCVGVVLCSVALTIWALFISAELQDVGSFARAIYHLPRVHGGTRVSVHKGTRVVESISCRRLVLLSFVILARCFIAVMLGYSGGVWLCQTRDVTNIMLNAVALLFVLDIDDVLYKVLTPKHAMQYLSSIQEFEVGKRKTWAGMDLSSMAKLLVLMGTVLLFWRYAIYENAVQARAAQDELCGGHRNFVYGSHPDLGPVFVTNTEEFSLTSAGGNAFLPGMRELVADFVREYNPDEVTSSPSGTMWRHKFSDYGNVGVKYVDSVEEMRRWLDMKVEDASELADDPNHKDWQHKSYMTSCADTSWVGGEFRDETYDSTCQMRPWSGLTLTSVQENLPCNQADWLWSTVKSITGGATDCQQARPFCDDAGFPLVRMMCPQTCGCTRADSGLFVANGCRKKCQKEDEFKQSLIETDMCESPAIHESEAWKRWWKGYYNTYNVEGLLKDNDSPSLNFAKSGGHGNCSVLWSDADFWWARIELCRSEGYAHHRPGTLFCPASCCNDANLTRVEWCPRNVSCALRRGDTNV